VSAGQGIHLMAKPAGPSCNLRCKYCFYLEKEALYGKESRFRMSNQVMEAYIRSCAAANMNAPGDIIFAWQGGEPTLMGVDFFHRAVALEKKYSQGHAFQNTLQTNGILLNDRWCEFLAKHNFLVGLSLDGPDLIHDYHRIDGRGEPTSEKVLRALRLLKKHGVEYNILACVSRKSSEYPLEVYRFFKSQGIQFIQFLPVVERVPDTVALQLGLRLGIPPTLKDSESNEVTPWTVEPQALGDFHVAVFNEWVRHDVGQVFVMNFEWTLFNSMGGDGAACYMSQRCGDACIVEHNGDIYSCDHFVYPDFKLGNILKDDVRLMVRSQRQREWGSRKENALPGYCKSCEVAFICRGGCPKHRFMETYNGEPGLNYLCRGYKRFYSHTAKYMKAFHKLIEYDLPLEYVMQAIGNPLVIPASEKTNNQTVVLWVRD
jgi:uncharacterized protein